jgi:hypothetical protein
MFENKPKIFIAEDIDWLAGVAEMFECELLLFSYSCSKELAIEM